MRRLSVLLCVAAVLGSAAAARLPYDLMASSSDGAGTFMDSTKGLLGLMRDVTRGEDKYRAHVAIKFIVPPSEVKKFEDYWLKLEKDVMKDEKYVDAFDLKKTRMDNTAYWSYGEWASMRDFHHHCTSEHFEKFAEDVEDLGVKWEIRFLKHLSADMEKERREMQGHEDVKKSRNMHHVVMHFMVPPGEGDSLTQAWMDCAEDTIKDEKHNREYELHKVLTDNTRYYVYGTWDSMGDFVTHYESKHFGRLLRHAEDHDVVWFIEPLIKIGNEPE